MSYLHAYMFRAFLPELCHSLMPYLHFVLLQSLYLHLCSRLAFALDYCFHLALFTKRAIKNPNCIQKRGPLSLNLSQNESILSILEGWIRQSSFFRQSSGKLSRFIQRFWGSRNRFVQKRSLDASEGEAESFVNISYVDDGKFIRRLWTWKVRIELHESAIKAKICTIRP